MEYKGSRYEMGAQRQRSRPPSKKDRVLSQSRDIEDLQASVKILRQEKAYLESRRTPDMETIEIQAKTLAEYTTEIEKLQVEMERVQTLKDEHNRRTEERAQTAEAKLKKAEDRGGVRSCCEPHAQLMSISRSASQKPNVWPSK